MGFQKFLGDLEELETHVKAYRFINKKIFLEMVERFHQSKHKSCIDYSGYKISNDQVDVLFAVLDLDGNGQLDYDEIIGVLQDRNQLASGKGDDSKAVAAAASSNIMASFKQFADTVRAKLGV